MAGGSSQDWRGVRAGARFPQRLCQTPPSYRYVLPEHLWIPITEDAEDVDKPEGVLHVKILNATGVRWCGGASRVLWSRVERFIMDTRPGSSYRRCACPQVPRMDLMGGCDPYLE